AKKLPRDMSSLSPSEEPGPKSGVATISQLANIEITIDTDFSSFSDTQKQRILRAIKEFLDTDSNISIRRLRESSVRWTMQLRHEEAERLYWAVKAGQLEQLQIVRAEFVDDLDDKTDAPPAVHSVAVLIDRLKKEDIQERRNAAEALG